MDQEKLKHFGWVSFELPVNSAAQFAETILTVATTLGEITSNRGRGLIDTLTPLESSDAHSKSLSALTGLGAQPWHVDLAHQQTPARYILLGCEVEGDIPVETELCDRRDLLPDDSVQLAYTEPFLVKNGRHSFYSTVLTRGEGFIRIDPGCMTPMTKKASRLMTAIQNDEKKLITAIRWKPGLIAVIDNWRMLHRRARAYGAVGRKLVRVSVMGEKK